MSCSGPLVLWPGEDPINADIVFVHGLNGHREKTWSHSSILWPKDLLPQDLPNARIITWGYNANVAPISGLSSQNSLHGHARNLLLHLERLREEDYERSRPVVFIGHSLGGLVVKGAIIRAQQLLSSGDDPERGAIYKRIAGVIFIGTPHRGSGTTPYANVIANIVGTFSYVNKKIIKDLEAGSAALESSRESFSSVSEGFHVVCFFEELPTPPLGLIVPQDSAVIDGRKVDQASIEGDHSSICKFPDKENDGYQKILFAVKKLLRMFRKSAEQGEKEQAKLEKRADKIILDALKFPTLETRRENIAEAYQDTFIWMLEDPGPGFVDWLRGGSGIFWLSGKAASGKSTLMKYMSMQAQLETMEGYWHASHPKVKLSIASFFFNARGTDLEKSQEGLLRSILHEQLSHAPSLIRHAFHKQWSEIVWNLEIDHPNPHIQWSISTLKDALAEFLAKSRKNVLLLVDGLDEYQGTSYDVLVDLLKHFAKSPKVKLCLSSRPLQVFEDAFADTDKIRLQDLTKRDIKTYITGVLGANMRFRALAAETAQRFMDEITFKASGVFLWVTLVVRTLVDGLRNHDPISQLLQELQDLPSDLEDLYQNMLERINPRYHDSAVRLFRIMLSVEGDEICPLALSLAHDSSEEGILDLESGKTLEANEAELKSKVDDVTVWLKNRCAGLLEVQSTRSGSKYVQYLHLTVKEYLSRQEILQLLGSQPSLDFCPYTRILTAILRLGLIFLNFSESLASSPRIFTNTGDRKNGADLISRSLGLLTMFNESPNECIKLCFDTIKMILLYFTRYANLMERNTSKTHCELFDSIGQLVWRLATLWSSEYEAYILPKLRRQICVSKLSRSWVTNDHYAGSEDDREPAIWSRKPHNRFCYWWKFTQDGSRNSAMNHLWLTVICSAPLEIYIAEKMKNTRKGEFSEDVLCCAHEIDTRMATRSRAGLLSLCLTDATARKRGKLALWLVERILAVLVHEYFDDIAPLNRPWASTLELLALRSERFAARRVDVNKYITSSKARREFKNKVLPGRKWTVLFFILSIRKTELNDYEMQGLVDNLIHGGACLSRAELNANPHLEKYPVKKGPLDD